MTSAVVSVNLPESSNTQWGCSAGGWGLQLGTLGQPSCGASSKRIHVLSGSGRGELLGRPLQNNRQVSGFSSSSFSLSLFFFVPRTGCIFVDNDSSLSMPVIEPWHVCTVYKALGHGLAWLVPTPTLKSRQHGTLRPPVRREENYSPATCVAVACKRSLRGNSLSKEIAP